MSNKLLVLCAPSGCGKTYLLETLCNKYSNLFYKVRQVTTRDRRPGEGDTYNFITKEEYEEIKHTLIGKTKIHDNYYGSIIDKDEKRIGIIILNEKGLDDFLQSNPPRHSYYSIGLNKDLDSIEVERDGRDISYLEEERNVLKKCDVVFNLGKDYTNPELIKSLTMSYFINYLNRIELTVTEEDTYLSTNYYDSYINSTISADPTSIVQNEDGEIVVDMEENITSHNEKNISPYIIEMNSYLKELYSINLELRSNIKN